MELVEKFVFEFLGTFLLVLTLLLSNNSPIAVGGVVAAIIWFGRDRSGAQINPAVSLARFLGGRLSLREFVGYVASQVAGAVASLYMFKVFG